MPLPPIGGIWRVGSDPELRFAPSGVGVAKFRAVASSAKKEADGSWTTTGEIWVTMIAFHELSEHVINTITKGQQIAVGGKIQVREFEHEGVKRTAVEVILDTVNALHDRDRPATGGVPPGPGYGDQPGNPQTEEPPF
jgi:single-strand DNA-binding protein